MEMLEITIDGIKTMVAKGATILEAAKTVGIKVPTLCHMELPFANYENKPAACRICVVEVQGRRNLAPACATPVANGMIVQTHSLRVINARKIVLELILSNHPQDCLTCVKSGTCELQTLAQEFGITDILVGRKGEHTSYEIDASQAIVRDMDKCIMCRRCETMCNDVQTVGAISAVNRGFSAVVSTPFFKNLDETVCTFCGQCAAVCPVGAIVEKDHTLDVLKAIADPEKIVIVQTAPAIRAALGEEFGLPAGTLVTGKMVSALKKLQFDYVFDTNFSADLTIMEEGTELLGRLNKFLDGDTDVKLPILTSCCPAWVKFFEHQFSDLLDYPSSAKSPQQMFGAIAKNYYAKKIGIPREKIVVVSIMPCIAKKFEHQRDEYIVDNNPDVDIVLTTRELAHLIKQSNIDLAKLSDEEFDMPLGSSTGAGMIFGTSGGVLEAALRTAYEIKTNKNLEDVNFSQVRGLTGFKEASIHIDETELKVAVVHGLGNARQVMDEIRAGECPYHVVEVMACPGGCIGGAGQPYHHGDVDVIEKRMEAVYREDENKTLRKSHENKDVQQLYAEYLGEPCGELSHHLLHTRYQRRKRI